ncbi:MAG: hypothetical protein WCB32_16775, partial [Pseudolabrys sp.]
LTSNKNPQQAIKSDEVIDMSMGHKDMLEPLELARRQIRKVAQIKKDRASFEQSFDVQNRIAGSPIHEGRVQKRPHFI